MFRHIVMSAALGLVAVTSSYPSQTASSAAISPAESRSAAKESPLSATVLSTMTDEQSKIFSEQVLRKVRAATYKTWRSSIPEEARPPLSKKGKVAIEFVLHANGSVSDMLLARPSGDVALDRAAWGAITSAKYEPFPASLDVAEVKLMLAFSYTEGVQ